LVLLYAYMRRFLKIFVKMLHRRITLIYFM